ncbi:thioredoxin [Yeguia hominis]|uniref:Thioredoxin n=1 Tax=Yeguia hominis TaxID=2763662 RepID=A0A926DBE9_9FIRM|nr:thioredoxin [Yeguia hominis]MBC8534777.1 thioredoxin [Yeguia hominis]
MEIVTLTADNFDEEAVHTTDLVLIDFWASWCGPCRMLSPVIEEIAQQAPAGVKVCKVNVDDEHELAAKFGVMSIPMLVVLKNGAVAASTVGVQPKAAILELLERAKG